MKNWLTGIAMALLVFAGAQMTGHGQAGASDDLAARLRDRYDVVALQQGVAFVPRETGRGIRMIQVADGVVTVDGETLTGAQLRTRLGSDADLILQVSYLTVQQQRALGGVRQGDQTSAPAAIERGRTTRGDRLRFGEPIRIEADERVEGDVFSFGGPVTVEGEITGDVTSFGGPVRLGPRAIVRGDINAMGGPVDRDPGAQVFGRGEEMGGRHGPFRRAWVFPHLFGSMRSRLGSLIGTTIRITLLVLLGIIVVAFGRNAIERIAPRIAASPVRAGLVGLLAEILFLPVMILTCIVLAVSIVGIPLLVLIPLVVLLLMLVGLTGFAALAYQLGGRIAGRFGWTGRGPYATVAIGVVAIGALTLVAKLAAVAGGFIVGAPLSAVGYLVEYVAWTIGFGAAILAWHESQPRFHRRGESPAAGAPLL